MTEFEHALIAQLQGINDKLALLTARAKPIKAAKQDIVKVSEDDVDEIYAAYPTKDERNGGRNLGKGEKSKELIRKRLQEGRTKQEMLDAIKMYLDGGSYLPNFNTFLNNLPCKEPTIPETPEPTIKWQ